MNSLRKLVKQTMSDLYPMVEAHYTTWKKIEEGSPIDKFSGEQTDIINKLAKHFKIGKVFPLGQGTNGFAYHIPNNQVLKITKDRSEAAEAHKIKGKKLKHLSNIYGTYSLKGKYEGTYVIISELLTKTEKIDNADQLLADFLDSEFGYSISFFFEDYSNSSMSKEEIQDYIKRLKKFYEPGEAKQAIWYMMGKFGIIDEIRKYGIHSTDWGLTNLGLKKDGNLAMYDLGYGDPDVPDAIGNIHLNEKKLEEFLSANEYPQFDDGQFNPIFHNRPSLPDMNMNTTPMSEENSNELDKKTLPFKYHYMWGDYIKSKGDSLTQIMPNIGLEAIQNVNTEALVQDLYTKNLEVYEDFSNWIDTHLHGTLKEAEMSQEEINLQLLPIEYHYMFDDFVTYTTESELREVAPTLDLNRNTKDIVLDIKKNYPSLYDNFAEWISEKIR